MDSHREFHTSTHVPHPKCSSFWDVVLGPSVEPQMPPTTMNDDYTVPNDWSTRASTTPSFDGDAIIEEDFSTYLHFCQTSY